MLRRALLIGLAVSSVAHADKKIQGMTPGFQREARTCATQVSGMKKVQTGAASLAPSLSPEDKTVLDKDLEALAAGLAVVETYCTAVTELVAFLEASKDASYKSVEKELDTRDNTVRKHRKESKKVIEAMTPITRRWIGRIAQNQIQRPDEAKPKPATFPSGHTAVLPNLGKGTWRVDGHKTRDAATYADGAGSAFVDVVWTTGGDCDTLKRTLEPAPVKDAIATAEGLDVAWHGNVARTGPSYSEALCARTAGGRILATMTQSPGPTDRFPLLRQLALDLARSPAVPAKTP